MKLADHCILCENQAINVQSGTICKLTNSKPAFNTTCIDIVLNEKFEENVKSANIEFKKILKTKTVIYIYFIVFMAIGFGVITVGYLLGKFAFDSGVISTVPLIIMSVGIIPMFMAIGSLIKHKQQVEVAKLKKDKIDQVIRLYKIKYKIDIKFGKEYHGKQEVEAILDLTKPNHLSS